MGKHNTHEGTMPARSALLLIVAPTLLSCLLACDIELKPGLYHGETTVTAGPPADTTFYVETVFTIQDLVEVDKEYSLHTGTGINSWRLTDENWQPLTGDAAAGLSLRGREELFVRLDGDCDLTLTEGDNLSEKKGRGLGIFEGSVADDRQTFTLSAKQYLPDSSEATATTTYEFIGGLDTPEPF